MLVLPEIQLESVVRSGFVAIANNDALLDDIFYNYPAAMVLEVKKYIKEHKVEVVLNWPREGMTMPTIAIVNAGDSESTEHDTLGDFFEELQVEATDSDITEYRGVAKNGTYQLLVLSQDPRLSMYLGYLLTTILVLNAPTFQAVGMHNMTINEADLRFEDGALMPEWANSRMVTVSCLHYHAVPVTDRLLTALTVDVQLSVSVNANSKGI